MSCDAGWIAVFATGLIIGCALGGAAAVLVWLGMNNGR